MPRIDLTELRRGIGYVIQQIGLFPHQTIADNVATVPRLLGWPKARMHERVDELLDMIGLEPGASATATRRSCRVANASAWAWPAPWLPSRRVMLMDEPFGAVDPIVRERLQNEFLRLHRTLGTTVLFVTHDIDEAIKMGNRVAVMQVGGSTRPVRAADRAPAPARRSEFVARFVGADRGLKRLTLLKVSDVGLEDGVVAHVGEPVGGIRQRAGANRYVLLLDTHDRPHGWVNVDNLPASGAHRG